MSEQSKEAPIAERLGDAPKPDWVSDCGRVVLWNADCLGVMAGLPDGVLDMIFSDPPYGHSNADGDWLSRRADIMRDGRDNPAVAIANDTGVEMRLVVDGMLTEAARVLRRDCCCCCCCCCCGGGPSPTFAWLAERMDRDGLEFFHSVIWDKKNPGVGWLYRRQHEMVMVAHRRGGKMLWADRGVKQPNVIALSKPRDLNHPNEKPLELCEKFIQNHAAANEVILDPFLGSGTTGVAAVRLDRQFLGIEIDPGYFQIAVDRIKGELNRMPLFEPPQPVQTSLLTEDPTDA